MGHGIRENDVGYLSGHTHWHGMPQYHLVGDRPVTIVETAKTVDFEVEKVPTYINPNLPSGAYSVVRKDYDGKLSVLAPAVGERYVAPSHKQIVNTLVENILSSYPTLKVCGAGTLNGGATFWIQMVVEEYYIKGDQSSHDLRLSYNHTYGLTPHRMYCTKIRHVCQNTMKAGVADAVAQDMMIVQRHTAGAEIKINENLELLARMHLAVKEDVEFMEHLASQEVNEPYIRAFMEEFFPKPHEEASTKAKNRWESDSRSVASIFHSGQHMDATTRNSKYALLNAYTDWADHHSYSRDPVDRWMDSQNGKRADMKDVVSSWLASN